MGKRSQGRRTTLRNEITQRGGGMGGEKRAGGGNETENEKEKPEMEQAAGCGGFGKGNFSELFKTIEQYERTLKV